MSKFLDVTDMVTNTVITINISQIVRIYEAADRTVIEFSDGKNVQVNMRASYLKSLLI